MLVSHFIENIFRSGLTLVSSNGIITIKIEKKNVKKTQENKQTKRLFLKKGPSNEQKGNELGKKECFKTLLFLEIVSVMKNQDKLLMHE